MADAEETTDSKAPVEPVEPIPADTPEEAEKEAEEEEEEDEVEPPVKKRPGTKNPPLIKRPASKKAAKESKPSTASTSTKGGKKGPKGKGKGSGKPGSNKKEKAEKPPKKDKPEKTTKSKAEAMMENFVVPEDDEQEEENEKPDSQEEGDEGADEGRNRSKAQKFFAMLKSNSLPQAVMDMWSTTHGREKQTNLINDLFEKKGRNYQIKADYMVPKVYASNLSTEREDKAKDQQSGYGKTIFKRKYNLSDSDLDEAVRGGEVRCFKSGSVWLYAAVNVLVESGVTKKFQENLGTEPVDIGEEAGLAFAKAFHQMVPEVNLQNPSSSARPVTSGPAPPLAIRDAPDAILEGPALEKAKESCKNGKKAMEKLMRDCKTLVGNLPNKDDDLFKDLILWF
eukprot:Skav235595  [mRNA]  locus=scaffold3336:10446:11744:+ [translate_table: standard]